MSLSNKHSLFFPVAILLFLWGTVIVFINPVGEFMINDDWSFISIIEDLLAGKTVGATGWGGGGPSVFSHITWGLLFSTLFGFSVTTLRISVLVLAIGASLALLVLIRQIGNSRWLALLATLTLMFNPLFLSQSFTFMTDITFVSWVIFSLLFFHMGIERNRQSFLIIGLLFALLSLLTRQIGLVIPLGFMLTCYLHPKGKQLNKTKMILLTVFITIVPWLLYEVFLWMSGSTPVTSHPVVHKIFLSPITKGFPDYFFFLLSQAGILLMYSSFLVSPLLVLRYKQLLNRKTVRRVIAFLIVCFFLFEICLIAGLIDPPVAFHRNVIYNFGIGPVLLKDIYLLGIQRTLPLPTPIFYLFVFWSLLSTAALLSFSLKSIRHLLNNFRDKQGKDVCFTSSFALLSALLYSGIILLTGFHDRYLIPVCVFLIVWFANQITVTDKTFPSLYSTVYSAVILLFFTGFSVFGLKDFMSTKRNLHKAHQYILDEMKVNPCDIDGGFEFNGYYCSEENSIQLNGKQSWWWVNEEKYLVSLGPLPNYQVVKKFPFQRYIGYDGAIHILKPNR